jgi:oligo-1,6-glucosidase
MKEPWWKKSVIYQIYPRSFSDSNGDGIGDLNGITEHIPYLKDLGIDVIWLSPIYESPNDDNGYDIKDYQNIMKEFGTMADFDRLLDTAHSFGIRIIMDLVVNHTSDEHPWFCESRKSKANPFRHYYIWREGKDGAKPNNWGSIFGGSAWEYDETTQMYYLHLFSKKQPDLNWDNPTVRNEIFSMMDWWLKKGIDGFRMDVISMISKVPGLPDGPVKNGTYGDSSPYVINGPHVHEYLKEMNQKVLSHYDLMTVGETAGVTIEQAKQYANRNGQELSMIFQFDHVSLEDDPKLGKWNDSKIPLPKLKQVLSKWQTQLHGIAWNSLYWSNHDQPRAVSRFGNDSPEYRQTSAKMLATCLHMMQGTPYIYQGEELGMTNASFQTIEEYRDIESLHAYEEFTESGAVSKQDMLRFLRYKSRDNARTPMQWNSSQNAGFSSGTPWIAVNPNYTQINAETQRKDPNSVFHYYQALIRLRKQYDIITYGDYQLLLPESETIFAYLRRYQKQILLCVCNFSETEEIFELPNDWDLSHTSILIHNLPDSAEIQSLLHLSPYEAYVFLFEKEG